MRRPGAGIARRGFGVRGGYVVPVAARGGASANFDTTSGVLHLHADDIVASGSSITSWASRIGSSVFTPFDGTPEVASDLYLGDVADFTNGGLRCAALNPTLGTTPGYTIYMVISESVHDGSNRYILGNTTYDFTAVATNLDTFSIVDTGPVVVRSIGSATANPLVLAIVFDKAGNTATGYFNGAVGAAANYNLGDAVDPDELSIGRFFTGSFGWPGRVGEVFIANRVDDASKVAAESAIFAARWPAPTFTLPTTDLILRLDARVGVTDAGSGKVSAWADQSTAGNDASQGTDANRPSIATNGTLGDVVRFDGSTSYMDLTGITQTGLDWTVFVVIDQDVASSNRSIIDSFAGRVAFQPVNAATGGVGIFDGVNRGGGTAKTGPQIIAWSKTGTALTVRHDGVEVLSTSMADNGIGGTTFIGSNYLATGAFYDGDVAFIGAYESGMTTPEMEYVEAYLRQEWPGVAP